MKTSRTRQYKKLEQINLEKASSLKQASPLHNVAKLHNPIVYAKEGEVRILI